MSVMRIVVMGTGQFAVPTFQALIDSDHEIAALITRPPVRGRKASQQPPNPMRNAAQRHQITVYDPPSINSTDAAALLKELAADLYVVCDYGQILSRRTLGTSRLGGINLHGSLLPKYRGAAPVNWAIYNGDRFTGVTVIHMTPKLDGGPCLAKQELEIAENDTALELELRLAALGPSLVLHSIEILASWDGQSAIGEKQDPQQTTQAPRLQKADGQVDWSRTAEQICYQIRAFKPWPGTFAFMQRDQVEPLRLIIDQATWKKTSGNEPPGTITLVSQTELGVQAGDSTLMIERVQPAGKRVLDIEEFIRGYAPRVGQTFIQAPRDAN